MKKSLFLLIAVMLLVSLAGLAPPAATKKRPRPQRPGDRDQTAAATGGDAKVLRMAVPWPVGDPVTDNIQQNFVDKFNAAQTQYKIELHPGGLAARDARQL